MPDLTIRPACGDDISSIAAIYRHSVETGTASFELAPPDEAEMLRRHEAIVANGYPYLVCTSGEDGAERVLGYSYASAYRPRPAYRGTVENSVYVAPDAHRMGVGRALLKALIEETTRRGFRQMVAVIGDSGHVASVELHRALGFETVGTLKNVGRKFGRWLDSVLMQRALGEGAETAPDEEPT